MKSPRQDKAPKNSVFSSTDARPQQSEAYQNVELGPPLDPALPIPPPRGITLAISSLSSPAFPDFKNSVIDDDQKQLVEKTGSPLSKQISSSESSLSSSTDVASLESTNKVESPRIDLMRTLPKGLNLNIQDLALRWTAEEVSRFQNHLVWLSSKTVCFNSMTIRKINNR
jgi:hypothetical protein